MNSIAIMVPTLVVSIFSMDVAFPPARNPRASSRAVPGLSATSLAAFTYVWRRNRW